MQAKMRSLLRLLVKSIIGDRERQADATAAWEAHHSPSPAVDPIYRTLGQICILAHMQTELWGNADKLRNRNLHF